MVTDSIACCLEKNLSMILCFGGWLTSDKPGGKRECAEESGFFEAEFFHGFKI